MRLIIAVDADDPADGKRIARPRDGGGAAVGKCKYMRYDQSFDDLLEKPWTSDRRVLILENPALPGQSRITGTLYAGLQLIRSREAAPAHRHTQNALRFIMAGEGAFSALDSERGRCRGVRSGQNMRPVHTERVAGQDNPLFI